VRVQQMWDDVTGTTTNVGQVNSDYGGTVDINVGGDTDGAQGVTTTVTGSNKATIILSEGAATSSTTLSHEMGHLAHARYSRSTWDLGASGLPRATQMEHAAVVEYLGEVNKVIYAQYNGPS